MPQDDTFILFGRSGNSSVHRKCGPDWPSEMIRFRRRLRGAWHDGWVPGAPNRAGICRGARLDTSPEKVGQPQLRTAAKRGEGLAFRRPVTLPCIRSMVDERAAVQPPTFRASGRFRPMQAGEACGPDLAAGELPPPDRNCRCRTCRAIRSHAGESRVRRLSGDGGRGLSGDIALAGPAEKRKLRPVAGTRPPPLRADPPWPAAMDAVGASTGLDVSRQSALGPCPPKARSWKYECVAGTPLPIPAACGPCPPRAHRLWQ